NTPPLTDTSSLAVLVEHAVTGTYMLVESALTGTLDRGTYMSEARPAAFAITAADETALHASLDRLNALAERLQQEAPARGFSAEVATPPAGQPPRTRVFSLIHAVQHLREHVGHAQLTRQMIEQG